MTEPFIGKNGGVRYLNLEHLNRSPINRFLSNFWGSVHFLLLYAEVLIFKHNYFVSSLIRDSAFFSKNTCLANREQ